MNNVGMKYPMIIFVALAVFLSSCASTNKLPAPAVTPGMAKKSIEKGVTTQEDIFTLFGAPNFMSSTKEGGELWVYSNYATVKKAAKLGLLGGAAGHDAAGLLGASGSYGSSSSRSITLMIKFNEEDTVVDYNVSQLQY